MDILSSPHRMLRMPQVKEMVGLSKAAIYNRIAKGTFPKSISLGGTSVAWLESEVIAWLEARIAASPGGKARLSRASVEALQEGDRPIPARTIVAAAPQYEAAERKRSRAAENRRHNEKLDALLAALRDYLIEIHSSVG